MAAATVEAGASTAAEAAASMAAAEAASTAVVAGAVSTAAVDTGKHLVHETGRKTKPGNLPGFIVLHNDPRVSANALVQVQGFAARWPEVPPGARPRVHSGPCCANALGR